MSSGTACPPEATRCCTRSTDIISGTSITCSTTVNPASCARSINSSFDGCENTVSAMNDRPCRNSRSRAAAASCAAS
ncbi:hypothetical protein NJ76_17055 [Rhodococcus sp. IITR03]|nr:hypothetical protein NJ76_17055 [Rhodococcus sp. IITR03]